MDNPWSKLAALHPSAQEILNEYIQKELQKHFERLITSDDPHEMRLNQGAVRALKNLLNLRNRAEKEVKNGVR